MGGPGLRGDGLGQRTLGDLECLGRLNKLRRFDTLTVEFGHRDPHLLQQALKPFPVSREVASVVLQVRVRGLREHVGRLVDGRQVERVKDVGHRLFAILVFHKFKINGASQV